MQAIEILSKISPLEVKIEAYKRKMFDFITVQEDKKHAKQEEALQILTDTKTEEFLYGGAAGGAKSWTGCSWLLFNCLAYPETKWFIGREELKRITESTLISFFKAAKTYNVQSFTYNGQKNFIQFKNGSRIDLLELRYKPSDPLFERFGSTDYTGGWIEEGGEIDFGAYEVLRTRIGRHYNDQYEILAKLFITCNPKKNWLYAHFYKPFKGGTLPKSKKFLQAFVQDNPFIESGYIDRLKGTYDKVKKERLLKGNWEYDDDPDTLCAYDDIAAIFDNDHAQAGKIYLTADVARLGSDRAIILVWSGWIVVDYAVFNLSLITDIQDKIQFFRITYGIPKKNCLADADGIGGGVVDNCDIEGFVNNATPVKIETPAGYSYREDDEKSQTKREQPNYNNYQTQCGYYLVEKIKAHDLWFKADIKQEYKEQIADELGQLKSWKIDDDKKIYLLPKKEIKKNIGRSPDWRDALLMRAHFDLRPKKQRYVVTKNSKELGLF